MIKTILHGCGFLVMLSLFGCSQNSQDLYATFESALLGPNEAAISPEVVNNIPYASMYARLGKNSQALLILGWIDSGRSQSIARYKWVSAEKEMLVTESGRIVKTVNLREGNLLDVNSVEPDPLSLGLLNSNTPHEWQFTLSWQPGYHVGYQATSQFQLGNIENVALPSGNRQLLAVTEIVSIPALETNYTNRYWLDPEYGQLVASEQYLYPGSERVKLSVGKVFQGERK